MAIAKRPKHPSASKAAQPDEQAAQAFISGASNGSAASPDNISKKPVMVRFDTDLLARVDAAAKRRGTSRSAWIQYTLSLALDQEDD